MVDFAILAPVPLEHLESGLGVQETKAYVAYGSQKWELFREVDRLREGERVPMLIYPSHDADRADLTYQIGWIGWYIGYVDEYSTKHADERNGHRPPTTQQYPEDNASGWAIFWHVEELQRLPDSMRHSIGDLNWRKDTAPYGPEIVALPKWFEEIQSHIVEDPAVDLAEPPGRVPVTQNRIIRDTALAQQLKRTYANTCQVCGLQLPLTDGRTYAEVHHIRPLGGEHNGTDVKENMLVLCPNHHAQFDYGVPRFLSADEVEIAGERYRLHLHHALSAESIQYHNEVICAA